MITYPLGGPLLKKGCGSTRAVSLGLLTLRWCNTRHLWRFKLWSTEANDSFLLGLNLHLCLAFQHRAAPVTSAQCRCRATRWRWAGLPSAVLKCTRPRLPPGGGRCGATTRPPPAPCLLCAATPATTSPFTPSARPGAATLRVHLSMWQQVCAFLPSFSGRLQWLMHWKALAEV